MAKDSGISISLSPESRNNMRLMRDEWAERAQAMMRMTVWAIAKEAFDQILSEIPSGPDYKELKESLKLVEVSGGRKGQEFTFAIYAPIKGNRIRSMDADKTVISVIAKKRQNRPSPDVLLLESAGPWTLDTIPFWPASSEATIVQRKTSTKEVEKLAKALKPKLPKILRQLNEMGRNINPSKPDAPGRVKRNAKAVPDIAMQALSLEFGGGGKSKTVFRKAIRNARTSITGLTSRFQEIVKSMTDPNSKKYKNYPKRMDKISSSEAAKFIGFQKRLGL